MSRGRISLRPAEKSRSPILKTDFVCPDAEWRLHFVSVQLEVDGDPVPRVGDDLWVAAEIYVVLLPVHGDGVEIYFAVIAMPLKGGVGPGVCRRTGAGRRGVHPLAVSIVPGAPHAEDERALPVPAIPAISNVLACGEFHARRSGGIRVVVV